MLSQIKNASINANADDTAFVAENKNFKQANEYIQEDFTNILRWSHEEN